MQFSVEPHLKSHASDEQGSETALFIFAGRDDSCADSKYDPLLHFAAVLSARCLDDDALDDKSLF